MLRKYTYLFLIAFLPVVMMGTAHAEPLPENSVYEEDYVAADLQMTGIFDRKSAELKLCGDTFIAELPDSEECIHTIKAEVVFVYKAGDNYVCVIENVSSTAGEGSKIVVRKPGAVAVYATVTFNKGSLYSTYEMGEVEYKNKALRRKYENSNYCEYKTDSLLKTATITGYVGSAEEIIIPGMIEGYKVTSIGDRAFYDRDTIKSVHIPNGVTSIGMSAFNSCDELSHINIPEGVKEIKSSAFKKCPKLTDVTLPSTLVSLRESAFEGCDSVTKLVIPSGVSFIGNMALACKNLISLVVEEGNEKYYSVDNCILTCSSSSGVTLIAVSRDSKMPEGVNCIRGGYYGCDWLTEITIPESVTEIGEYAFYGCENLKKIELHDKVIKIGMSAFEKTGFTEFEIPETITDIGKSAFAGMPITKMVIPKTITRIPDSWFYGCKELEEIIFIGELEEIGKSVFNDCENLKTIELSDKITAINYGTFRGCKKMIEIKLPEGIKQIGEGAFAECESIRTIKLPDGLETIGRSAFCKCYSLESLIIPKGVKEIRDWTFMNDISLKELYIPATITEIGRDVFANIENSVVIYGEEGSYAEKFAKDNGIAFVPTDYYNSVQ